MEEMSDLPVNVKLSSWLPQQRILSHPNLKLFITHGGLLSTQEAIQYGVPLIGIPISFDQDMNMHSAESSGIGLKVEIIGLTEPTLESAITRVLNETSFKDNAQRLSSIFRDRINSPLDTAMYWVEYVMRHKGAHHLRSAARKLNFLQYHSLDVIATLLSISVLLLGISASVLIFVVRKLHSVFIFDSNLKQKIN
jgi:glucuronosyltransferase